MAGEHASHPPMPPPNSNTMAKGSKWGWTHRVNRVPHFQRLFQHHDGNRDWYKTPKSKYLLYPFWCISLGSFAMSQYMMGRLVMGHKTLWGPG